MRIIQINYSLCQGGAERFIVDLSNELAKKHEIILITIRDDKIANYSFFKNEVSPKVKYINFPIKEGFRITDVFKLNKFIDSFEPDIIHTHLNTVFYFLFKTFFNRKTKIFHTIHNDAFFDGRLKIPSKIRFYSYKWHNVYPITISNKSNQSFEEFYNLNVAKLIYNGRKKPNKSKNFEKVKEEISQLKLDSECKIFIHLSRFVPEQKNHELLFEAFNQLSLIYPNIILLVIGQGYDSDIASTVKNKANSKTFFLGERNNVADYLYCSDAFCLSSYIEGLPISLLEALACGVVPICTPVGGIVDVIENEKTGFLSKSVDKENYFKALKRFMEKPNLISKSELIHHFEQNYSMEICAKRHIKYYQKVLSEN